jgi:hypothetical protein
MAVVVNEFEVLPAAPAAPEVKESERKEDGSRSKLEPGAVSAVLRALAVHSLRSWAH